MAERIFIVDDDADLLEQLKIHLETAGYEVVAFETAEDAQTALESERPDLAIFDLMLEEFDSGFILCHKAKATHPDLPVIMLSAVAAETGVAFDASTESERSWLRADVFLNKPVRPEQLLREVRRLLKSNSK